MKVFKYLDLYCLNNFLFLLYFSIGFVKGQKELPQLLWIIHEYSGQNTLKLLQQASNKQPILMVVTEERWRKANQLWRLSSPIFLTGEL